MAFRLVKDPLNTQAEYLPVSSLTLALGSVVELDIGATAWTAGNASTEHWQKKAVLIEAAASTDTEVLAVMVNDYQLWEVDTDSNSAAADNGDRMLLSATAGQVNNTGTDNTSEEACFIQKAPVDAAADANILGWLVAGTGINPDAA